MSADDTRDLLPPTPASSTAPAAEADARRAIWNEHHLLTKARREEAARVMAEYDKKVHWPALKALRARCAALGHNWQFTHTGPLGDPWFSCHTCGASECRVEPRAADLDDDQDD